MEWGIENMPMNDSYIAASQIVEGFNLQDGSIIILKAKVLHRDMFI